MKNRLFGLLILSIFIFIGFFWLISRETKEIKNIENNSGSIISDNKNPELKKIQISEKEQTSSGKIQELNENNFAYFKINSENFYFNISNSKLELKNDENVLGFFELVLKNDLNILEIKGEEKLFLIEVGKKKYIYSKENGFIKDFETELFINYAKVSDGNFIFYSKGKGSFILYKEKNDLEFFNLLYDFIFLNDGYIGVIKSNNTELMQRFDLKSENILIYFEPKDNKLKQIINPNFKIQKIWEENKQIFIENEKNEIFEIINII